MQTLLFCSTFSYSDVWVDVCGPSGFLSTFCFHMSQGCVQSCSCFWFCFIGSQSSVVTPVPPFPVLESMCVRALHDKHEKLDVSAEASAVTPEITDKENAESDSQRTWEEEGLEPAKKKLKGG